MTKDQEQSNREQLHRLLDVVLDVNGFEARSREETGEKPTVFIDISGHVARCLVRVHKTGWAKGETDDLGSEFHFDEPMKIDELIKRLGKLKR